MDVGEMDLDDGNADGRHGVAEPDRIVSERARIEHDAAIALPLGTLQPRDQLALEVRLPAVDAVP